MSNLFPVPRSEPFHAEGLLRAVTTQNDRYGLVQNVIIKVQSSQNSVATDTLAVSSQTHISQLIALLGYPRDEKGFLHNQSITVFMSGTYSIQRHGYEVVIPYGSLPLPEHPSTCPRCLDSARRLVTLQQVGEHLRCPNPVCPSRQYKRAKYFIQTMMGWTSPNINNALQEERPAFGSIVDILDYDNLLQMNMSGGEKHSVSLLIDHLRRVFTSDLENTTIFNTCARSFLLALSIPGLTHAMIRDVIDSAIWMHNPMEIFTLLVNNIIMWKTKGWNNSPTPMLQSFLHADFPPGDEMDYYVQELKALRRLIESSAR